jgi:uncharacterized iron-regulated protein
MMCFHINKSFGFETDINPYSLYSFEQKKDLNLSPGHSEFDTESLATPSLESIKCPNSEILNLSDVMYIFIGEDHRDRNSKKFIIEQLEIFKKLNFEIIFVEYIESKDQKIADLYNQNPAQNRENLFRTYGLPGDWGYDPKGYLLLTDALGESGIKVFGLDRRSDLRKNMDLDQQMTIRDQHMFEVASKYIHKNPDQKVIFLNGSSHSFINKELSSSSFYELFTTYFKDLYKNNKILNLKVDYLDPAHISQERLALSQIIDQISDPMTICPADSFILFKNNKSQFDYFVFPKSKDILPPHDVLKTSVI